VPELSAALNKYQRGGAAPSAQLTASLRSVFQKMEEGTSDEPVTPSMFVAQLRSAFPQFDERGPTGHHKQQDADELMGAVLNSVLKPELRQSSVDAVGGLPADLGGEDNLVDALFGLRLEEELTCAESDAEAPKRKEHRVQKLVCNIEGAASALASGRKVEPVDHLHQGVLMGFENDVELRSEALGRNAVWRSKKRVDRLPRYICFQFMRFFWKRQAGGVDVNTTAAGSR
jgi:ubiquitin carboxyl-terminal hydrolase 14